MSLPIILIIHNWHPVLMTLPEAAHFGGAKRPVKERPLVPPLIDGRSMLKTITSTCCFLHYFQSCKEFIGAERAHVGESCSMPSSAVGSVGNEKGGAVIAQSSLRDL